MIVRRGAWGRRHAYGIGANLTIAECWHACRVSCTRVSRSRFVITSRRGLIALEVLLFLRCGFRFLQRDAITLPGTAAYPQLASNIRAIRERFIAIITTRLKTVLKIVLRLIMTTDTIMYRQYHIIFGLQKRDNREPFFCGSWRFRDTFFNLRCDYTRKEYWLAISATWYAYLRTTELYALAPILYRTWFMYIIQCNHLLNVYTYLSRCTPRFFHTNSFPCQYIIITL